MADDVNNQDPNANGTPDNGTNNTQNLNQPVPDQTLQDLNQQAMQSALLTAVQNGDRVKLDQLIDQGADANKVDQFGNTAIGDAVAGNDKNISRDFLQQKANGNLGYDPTLDPSLTGLAATNMFGLPQDLTTAGGISDVGSAAAMGLTADQAAAMGNYALAAQLEAQEDFATEALEANDSGSVDTTDGDWSYAASVADMDGWGSDDEDEYNSWDSDWDDDYYGDDDGWYADDDYGYDDDYYYDDYADTPSQGGTTTANGYDSTGSTTSAPGTGQSSFLSSFLTVGGDVLAFDLATSGMGTLSTAATDLTKTGATAFNTAIDPSLTATSSFFDMSAPLTGTSVWNTSFFDPASINTGTTSTQQNNNTLALNTTPTIAPTNPYYKASSGTSMAM